MDDISLACWPVLSETGFTVQPFDRRPAQSWPVLSEAGSPSVSPASLPSSPPDVSPVLSETGLRPPYHLTSRPFSPRRVFPPPSRHILCLFSPRQVIPPPRCLPITGGQAGSFTTARTHPHPRPRRNERFPTARTHPRPRPRRPCPQSRTLRTTMTTDSHTGARAQPRPRSLRPRPRPPACRPCRNPHAA